MPNTSNHESNIRLSLILPILFPQKSCTVENVALLHQLVQHSKDEHTRQSTARNKQAEASANEEVNRSKMDAFKTKVPHFAAAFSAAWLCY
jgi:hypothetical protein